MYHVSGGGRQWWGRAWVRASVSATSFSATWRRGAAWRCTGSGCSHLEEGRAHLHAIAEYVPLSSTDGVDAGRARQAAWRIIHGLGPPCRGACHCALPRPGRSRSRAPSRSSTQDQRRPSTRSFRRREQGVGDRDDDRHGGGINELMASVRSKVWSPGRQGAFDQVPVARSPDVAFDVGVLRHQVLDSISLLIGERAGVDLPLGNGLVVAGSASCGGPARHKRGVLGVVGEAASGAPAPYRPARSRCDGKPPSPAPRIVAGECGFRAAGRLSSFHRLCRRACPSIR